MVRMRLKNNQKSLIALLVIIFCGPLLFNTCSDNPVILENNLDNPLVEGEVRDTVLYAMQDTSYIVSSKINNQFSPYLAIGSYKGFVSRPILRFTTNFPDSAIFTKAVLRLKADGYISDGSPAPFTATLYEAKDAWSSNLDSVWNDYTMNMDLTRPLGTMEVTPSQNDTLSLEFNQDALEILSFWADTSTFDDNGGVILDFSDANYIQYLTSINVELDVEIVVEPLLIFDYHTKNDNTIKTDTVSATFDAYVYSLDIPAIPDRNYVSSQINFSTLLKFDLDGILKKYPKGVDVLSANLRLPVDKENSLTAYESSTNLQVQMLLSDINSQSVEVDSSFGRLMSFNQWSLDSSFIEIISGDERKNFARLIIQSQLVDLNSSSALIIDYQNKNDKYAYIASYKKDNIDSESVPKLILTFRIPPSARF
jgi:hypothetical protein